MVAKTQEVLKRCDPFGVCYTKQQVEETCGQENPRYPDTEGVPCSFKTQATLHCAALPSPPVQDFWGLQKQVREMESPGFVITELLNFPSYDGVKAICIC